MHRLWLAMSYVCGWTGLALWPGMFIIILLGGVPWWWLPIGWLAGAGLMLAALGCGGMAENGRVQASVAERLVDDPGCWEGK